MDLIAADLYDFAPITQGITGDGTNTHSSGSPGAGVLNIHLAAGGVAQFLAGNSEFENWYVFLDDPRDTYHVMQGIEIYEEEN